MIRCKTAHAVELKRVTPSLAAVKAQAARLVPGRKHTDQGDTHRVAARREHQLPAQASDRVQDNGPLQVDRQPSPFSAIQYNIDHGQPFVFQLECRPVALAKLDPVITDRHWRRDQSKCQLRCGGAL